MGTIDGYYNHLIGPRLSNQPVKLLGVIRWTVGRQDVYTWALRCLPDSLVLVEERLCTLTSLCVYVIGYIQYTCDVCENQWLLRHRNALKKPFKGNLAKYRSIEM